MKFYSPPGTRDYVLEEARLKKKLEREIETCLANWNYQVIETPTIEYYENYRVGFESLNETALYKFIDEQGNLLSLRADMTIPIARVVAKKFRNAEMPLRFRYCASVFKIHEELTGKKNEICDCGVELLGLSKETGDLEIITCALDVLTSLENMNFILELGDSRFFNQICEKVEITDEEKSHLAKLVGEKKVTDLALYLEKLALPEDYQVIINQLVWWNGKFDVLEKAREKIVDEDLLSILDELALLYEQIDYLGYGDLVHIDLGKIGRLNYYTGIIFEAFVEGVGLRILSGGRYDQLLKKFGFDLPAVGFSIKVDQLLKRMESSPQPSVITIEYPQKLILEALKKRQMIGGNSPVALKINNELTDICVRGLENVDDCLD